MDITTVDESKHTEEVRISHHASDGACMKTHTWAQTHYMSVLHHFKRSKQQLEFVICKRVKKLKHRLVLIIALY